MTMQNKEEEEERKSWGSDMWPDGPSYYEDISQGEIQAGLRNLVRHFRSGAMTPFAFETQKFLRRASHKITKMERQISRLRLICFALGILLVGSILNRCDY